MMMMALNQNCYIKVRRKYTMSEDIIEKPNEDLFETKLKFLEAKYFLEKSAASYHYPLEFQFNLNAFIQAFRNITFMLQSEDKKPSGFIDWYSAKQKEMSGDALLRNFVKARNTIVKQSSLKALSSASVGVFRGRRVKLVLSSEISPFIETKEVLEFAKSQVIGFLLDEEHSAIGEQLGIERNWVLQDICDSEIIGCCLHVLNYMGNLIAEAEGLFGIKSEYNSLDLDMPNVQVLLETDMDPTLEEKWGWK